MGYCRIDSPLLHQRGSEICVRNGKPWINLQCFLKVDDCLVQIPAPCERLAEIVVRISVARNQLKSLLVVSDRFPCFPGLRQGYSQVVMCQRFVGVERQSPPPFRDGLFIPLVVHELRCDIDSSRAIFSCASTTLIPLSPRMDCRAVPICRTAIPLTTPIENLRAIVEARYVGEHGTTPLEQIFHPRPGEEIAAKVAAIEYDPNRSARIGLSSSPR